MMAAEWPVSTRLSRPRSDEGMTGLGHLRPWAALVVAAPPEGRAALAVQSSTCCEMLRASSTSMPR